MAYAQPLPERRRDLPPIDMEAPATVETATFAFG
jgi:hypothetical protein